jgi:hydroxymethylpyrimidine/phosphomethylpyrimidine kinase
MIRDCFLLTHGPKCATARHVQNVQEYWQKRNSPSRVVQHRRNRLANAVTQGDSVDLRVVPDYTRDQTCGKKETEHRRRGMLKQRRPSVLTIAGSDSGGCAGIQGDLQTIAAFGLHGLSVITAVTAQNTRRVHSIHAMPPREIAAQIDAVFADFDVAAIKIGMLGRAGAIAVIAAALRARRAGPLVIDPVLVSTSGAALLTPRGLKLAWRELFPLADLLTPNVPEAETLLGRRIRRSADLVPAARDLLASGARAVLLKGGHLGGRMVRDVLVDAASVHEFTHARLPYAVRGTGCSLASAVACGLARGRDMRSAVHDAEVFLQTSLRKAYRPGRSAQRALGHTGI